MFRQLSLFETYASASMVQDLDHEDLKQLAQRRMHYRLLFDRPGIGTVSVISVRMESPLVAVLEIPPTLWLGAAFGFLALAERIAIAPVRIARKRKEELLKIAITDEQLARLNARADALGLLLLSEGPHQSGNGPDEIVFLDPDEPSQPLVDTGERPHS